MKRAVLILAAAAVALGAPAVASAKLDRADAVKKHNLLQKQVCMWGNQGKCLKWDAPKGGCAEVGDEWKCAGIFDVLRHETFLSCLFRTDWNVNGNLASATVRCFAITPNQGDPVLADL